MWLVYKCRTEKDGELPHNINTWRHLQLFSVLSLQQLLQNHFPDTMISQSVDIHYIPALHCLAMHYNVLYSIASHCITSHCIWSKLGITLGWARPSGGGVLLPQVASDGPDRPQPDKTTPAWIEYTPLGFYSNSQEASDGPDRLQHGIWQNHLHGSNTHPKIWGLSSSHR